MPHLSSSRSAQPTPEERTRGIARAVRTIARAAASLPTEDLELAIGKAETEAVRGGADEARAELELLRATRGYRIDLEELAALALDVPLTPHERRAA